MGARFLSTLSLRRATLLDVHNSPNNQISIHALLAESDALPGRFICSIDNFYPRSPCGERRSVCSSFVGTSSDFYPRSPCGERPALLFACPFCFEFLSTLSLRRATLTSVTSSAGTIGFLSTLSLRRATSCFLVYLIVVYFYPRSPCGERRPLCRRGFSV